MKIKFLNIEWRNAQILNEKVHKYWMKHICIEWRSIKYCMEKCVNIKWRSVQILNEEVHKYWMIRMKASLWLDIHAVQDYHWEVRWITMDSQTPGPSGFLIRMRWKQGVSRRTWQPKWLLLWRSSWKTIARGRKQEPPSLNLLIHWTSKIP